MSTELLEFDQDEERQFTYPVNQFEEQLLQDIYDNWTYVTFDENGDELHAPASKKEIKLAEVNLREFEMLEVTNDDLRANYREIKETLESSKSRQFIGSWWIIAGVALYILFQFGSSWSLLNYEYPIEQARSNQQSHIGYVEQGIQAIESKPVAEQNQDALTNLKQNLAEITALSPEEYRQRRLDKESSNGLSMLWNTILLTGVLIAYFYASKAPQYLINKRQRQLELKMKSANFIKKAIMGIAGFFLAKPWVTFYDVRADGSKTYSDSNLSSGIVQLLWKFGMPVLLALIVILTMVVLLPVLTIISYVRNYHDDKLENMFSRG